jgi:hypothetical protein
LCDDAHPDFGFVTILGLADHSRAFHVVLSISVVEVEPLKVTLPE